MSDTKLADATIEQLKAAAEKLNIVVDGRWGIEKLREVVGEEMQVHAEAKAAADKRAAELAAEEAAAEKPSSMPDLAAETAARIAADAELATVVVSADETPNQRKLRLRREATALVRIHVSCMDPSKAKLKGELLCVSNKNFGTIQRYIPFNRDWHVERVLFDALKEKEYMIFDEEKTPRAGISVKTPRNVKAFNIRELPPLTATELKELAQRQAMADGTQV